mgnify:CR=1 FL=1
MARRPTIIDVAQLAGVSKTTVARVVSGEDALVRPETRQRVLDAIAQLGYERNAVAGSLRTDRTFMIALSIPDIMNPFWPEVARGVQDTVEASGYTIALLNSDWSMARERQHLSTVRRNHFDGLILNPMAVSNADLLALQIPVIVLGSGSEYPDFDAVGSDSDAAVHLAMAHLFALGHRRIGLIDGLSQRPRPRQRYSCYVAFHQQQGLPLDETLVVGCPFSQEAGARAMTHLLSLEQPPTAVCAADDILAIGALMAAREMGVNVPEAVSVIGIDDIYAAAATNPPLTTVAKPKYDIGVGAARFLLERIDAEGPEERRHVRLACELVQRGSTAPPADVGAQGGGA